MRTFIIKEQDDMPIEVQYNDHDVTIVDIRHEDNSITLTRKEFGMVVAGLLNSLNEQ